MARENCTSFGIQKRMINRQVNLKALLPFVIILALIMLLAVMMKFSHIKINLTPSMPIGLYRQLSTTIIHRGDIVSACLPLAIAKFGLERGCLTKGNCPGGSIPVLKNVIAVPGDTVQLTSYAIIVNNKSYLAPQHSQDQLSRSIKQWGHNGTTKVINGYWLYGSHSPKCSWDSRYYHKLPRSMIRSIYAVVLAF